MKKTFLIVSLSLATLVTFGQTAKTAHKATHASSTAAPDPDYDFKIKPVNDQTTIDTLKKLLLNKTLWIRYFYVNAYDPATKKYTYFHSDDFHYQPVKVVDVTLSNIYLDPYRIFVQYKTGAIYFCDIDVDPDKDYNESNPFDDTRVPYDDHNLKRQHISSEFFSFNPVVKYHLTPTEIIWCRHGDIHLGMRDVVFKLIKGEPTTTNYSPGLMQWVYEDGSYTHYYYFSDDGRLKSYN